MSAETVKKRQKEAARRLKQQKKLARRQERKLEKLKSETTVHRESPEAAELGLKHRTTIL